MKGWINDALCTRQIWRSAVLLNKPELMSKHNQELRRKPRERNNSMSLSGLQWKERTVYWTMTRVDDELRNLQEILKKIASALILPWGSEHVRDHC